MNVCFRDMVILVFAVLPSAAFAWFQLGTTDIPGTPFVDVQGSDDLCLGTLLDREPSGDDLHSQTMTATAVPEPSGDTASPGLMKLLREYDQATVAPFFPGMLVMPRWMCLVLLRVLDEPVDEHQNRMLHIAARSGNHFAAWALMDLGADPHVMNVAGQTPLQSLRCLDPATRQAIAVCLRGGNTNLVVSSDSGAVAPTAVHGRG